MNTQTAANAINRAYKFHDPNRTSTRADAITRTVSAWRAYCHLRAVRHFAAQDARGLLRAVIHANQDQHDKDPAAREWRAHVTMPHNLYAYGRTPRPDEIQPEPVSCWLRLIESSWRHGVTELDRRAYWRAAYAAHLDAQNC